MDPGESEIAEILLILQNCATSLIYEKFARWRSGGFSDFGRL